MAWLSISLPNPFKSDDENLTEKVAEEEGSSSNDGGVKEDLSELGKTIGQKLWGVASILAPPPVAAASNAVDSSDSSSQALLGIRNDFAEIGGSFKSGLSFLSTSKAVNEISRLATNLLQLQNEDDAYKDGDESSGEDYGSGIVGVSEEVVEFVREMSMRPEFWTDFPLLLNNDFHMSNAQREHASTVEGLAPSLVALRVRLCPSHMNEGHFWMIYFILLHPRLNEHDSKLISTLQIMEARDELLRKLQKRMDEQVDSSKSDDTFVEFSNRGSKIHEESSPVQEKEVLAETLNAAHEVGVDEQENNEQWLEEEDDETDTFASQKQLGNEVDVSFSDLEDDDDIDGSSRQQGLRSLKVIGGPNDSNEWIQLSENSNNQEGKKKAVQSTSREKDSEGEESNDWLTIDDFD